MLFTYDGMQWGRMQAPNGANILCLTDEEQAQIRWDRVQVLGTYGDVLSATIRGQPMPLSTRLPAVTHIYMECIDHLATAAGMGLHPRLGERSPLRALELEVVQMIVRLAFE